MPELLTIPEVSARTGYPETTLRYWIRHGHLSARLIGGVYLIGAAALKKMSPPTRGRPAKVVKTKG